MIRQVVKTAGLCMVLVCFLAPHCRSAGPTKIKNVLVLFPQDGWAVPAYRMIHDGMKSIFDAGTGEKVNLFSENLDQPLFPTEIGQLRLAEFLRNKYALAHIDALVPVTVPVLRFVLQHREKAFPVVPVVYCLINVDDLSQLDKTSNVTGAAFKLNIAETIDIARNLQPDMKHLAVVAGNGPTDAYLLTLTRKAFSRFDDRLEWIDLVGLPMGNLLQRVSQLPTSSVILFLTLTRDGTGNRFVSAEAQQLVSTSANVPLYNFIDAAFGYGSVGGCMIPIEANGRRAAELVSRVLAGEKADAIAPVVIQDNPHLFDWRELKRWGIAESTLPPGSVVHFKAPSIWETHKWSIVGIAAFFLVQSAFIAGLSINLARRKRAEAALLLSEANLKTAQEVAQIGGFIFDIPQDALSWSEGTREVFGVPVGTKIRYRAFLRMVHPDDRDYVDANWQTAQKGAPTEIEYRTVIGGNTRWIRTKVAVELTSEGRPLVARGIVQDISDRKKSEEEAAWLRHELAHAARISTVGELGQNLAHEVNQPLAAIVANAEAGLLLLKEPQPDLAEVQEALKDIVSDQKRAEAVVRRIRSLVKKDRPVFRRVDLNDVARDAAAVVQADATAQGVRIHTDLADGLPPVWGDTVQLQQVAINLLTNALDAVDSDATAPHWIRITTSAAGGDDPTLAVSDNGPGIDAKIAAHLFAPFFTTKSDGMGLGLSISRSIVTAHGGTIRAEANDNGGATFKVSLPTVSQACVEGDAAACPRTGV